MNNNNKILNESISDLQALIIQSKIEQDKNSLGQ